MRRAFVSLPDGVWKILDEDFKGQIGEGDSEVIRAVVVAYLSEKGYFFNQEGNPTVANMEDRIDVLETMVESLSELLEEKGGIKYSDWENRIKSKLDVRGKRAEK